MFEFEKENTLHSRGSSLSVAFKPQLRQLFVISTDLKRLTFEFCMLFSREKMGLVLRFLRCMYPIWTAKSCEDFCIVAVSKC